jgi:predicted DsbA family dithiol-disulfide isomerase
MMSSNPRQLSTENLIGYATALKLDIKAFRSCLESEKYKNAIARDVAEAGNIGARGTPAFVLGRSTPEGVDAELLRGAVPYTVLDQKLQQLALAK